MATFDWQSLAPVHPLGVHDERYVRRPWSGGDELAAMVRHRLSPLLVAGSLGSGRTTELRRARAELEDELLVLQVAANELVPLENLEPDRLIYEIGRHLLDKVIEADPVVRPSRGVVEDIRASDPTLPRGSGLYRQPKELVEIVIREIKEIYGRERVALFIDGLDETPGPLARETVRHLLELRDAAELAIIASPAMVYGPESHTILGNSRVWWLPTVPIDRREGRSFLGRVAARRLRRRRLPRSLEDVSEQAARASGGITRLFLHLVQDAALYAVASGRKRPTTDHLARAIRDRTDALRRLLVAGDLEAIAAADGDDGIEVPADRKVRLLAHNLLVEYAAEDEVGRIVRPHPLLRPLLARRAEG